LWKHPRSKSPRRIVHIQLDRHCARLRVNRVVDARDSAREGFTWEGGNRESDFRPRADSEGRDDPQVILSRLQRTGSGPRGGLVFTNSFV
jgi:hypothetical protein